MKNLKNTLESLVLKYGKGNVENILKDINITTPRIGLLPVEFKKVGDLLLPMGAKVHMNRNGQAVVYDTLPYEKHDRKYRGTGWVLAYSNGRYWIRGFNEWYIHPLHYNKETREYGFKEFDEMLNHFVKFYKKITKK